MILSGPLQGSREARKRDTIHILQGIELELTEVKEPNQSFTSKKKKKLLEDMYKVNSLNEMCFFNY